MWHETSSFHAPTLWSRWTQQKNFLFLILNLDMVLLNSNTENFANILKESDQEVWNSLSDVFFGMLSSRHFATMATWSNNFSSMFPSALKKNYNSESQKPTNMCLHGTCTLMINMVMKSTWNRSYINYYKNSDV